MKIFADQHHAGLFESLRILFVDRLGHALYRPIGMEWFDVQPEGVEKYWMLARPYGHARETARQFLDLEQQDLKVEESWKRDRQLNRGVKELEDGVYLCEDINHKTTHYGITFEAFKHIKFDILIASIPDHIEPYKELIRLYQPQAKLIFQIGNAWSAQAGQVKNVMASAVVRNVPPDINFISYHQEFSLDTFRKGESHQNRNVYSLIHTLKAYPDWPLFLELERTLPEYNFKSFGAGCRDGGIHGPFAVADKIRESMFGIHLKAGGDGYGHALFNFFACGRPPIIKAGYYRGKMAESLLIDKETCIFVDGRSIDEVAQLIRQYSELGKYNAMVDRCQRRFEEVVDFDKEVEQIKVFLEKLQ